MHESESAEDRVVPDAHMAGERSVICHDDVVPDLAIVGDVDVGHDPIVAAHSGDSATVLGAAIETAIFPYGVAITNFQ